MNHSSGATSRNGDRQQAASCATRQLLAHELSPPPRACLLPSGARQLGGMSRPLEPAQLCIERFERLGRAGVRRPGRSWLYGPLAVALMAGCSSAPVGDVAPSWPPGVYRVSGTVTFQDDSPAESRSARLDVWGEVTVTADGPVSMRSSAGPCRDPETRTVQRELSEGRRSFECDGTSFSIRRASRNLRGTIRVVVAETIRVRGPCTEWRRQPTGGTVCVTYDHTVRTNRSTKSVPFRSRRLPSS